MTNIGVLYYNAQGVERDLVEAYAWFARVRSTAIRAPPTCSRGLPET